MSGLSTRSVSYSNIGKSILAESEIAKLQRDTEFYTKELEIEKRRYYTLEDQKNSLLQEYNLRKERVTEYEMQSRNTQTQILRAKTQNLENQIQINLKNFNAQRASNKKLMNNIDHQRKERLAIFEKIKYLTNQYGTNQQNSQSLSQMVIIRKQKNDFNQQHLFDLQNKYKDDLQSFNNRFMDLKEQQQMTEAERKREANSKVQKEKIEMLDPSNILRRRLQKIIFSNKEKVDVIDQYEQQVVVIDEAFQKIKEFSGIYDIQEIQDIFIKSQDQNSSLYNFNDVLNQEYEQVQKKNKKLEQTFSLKKMELDRLKNSNKAQSDQQLQELKQQQLQEKKKVIENLQSLFADMNTPFRDSLVRLQDFDMVKDLYKPTPYKDDLDLNENNMDQYLGDLDCLVSNFINHMAKCVQKSKITDNLCIEKLPIKEFTKAEGSIQILNEDLVGDNQSNILDYTKLREIAQSTVEKKKHNEQKSIQKRK